MFLLLSLTLACGMGFLLIEGRPRVALWVGWIVSVLLLPTWSLVHIGPFDLDLRTVAAVLGLAGMGWSGLLAGQRWIWADVAMGLLILVLIDSEYEAGDLGPLRIPEILRIWALPYLVGRFFLGTRKDRHTLQPLICLAVLTISLYGIFEAVVRVNPLVAAFGQQFGFLDAPEGQRWGLKRAQGLLNHPIYFGYALALFLPWVFEARRAALNGEGPAWWRCLPYVTFACLFVTGSRAAIFIGGLCAVSPWLLEIGRRKPFSVAALFVAVAVLICCDDRFLGSGLSQLAGEEETTMLIHGEEVQYSGTNHRLLLFTAFGPSLTDLGMVGMGSQLQGLDTEGVPETFVSMDSHYLRFSLQHGYLAVGLFLALAGLTLAGLARRARESRFEAQLCGAMAGITFMLFTVWFAPDFGSVLLFFAGLAGNLAVLDSRESARSAESVALASEPRRIRPSYAPALE